MKIDVIGASNIAVSMYKTVFNTYTPTTETNIITVLQSKTQYDINSYVGFTVAKTCPNEKSYTDYVPDLTGGDVLIVQGAGNDFGMNVEIGNADSFATGTYCGALNYIADETKGKYTARIFTTGFNIDDNAEREKYNDSIRMIAKKSGIYLLDFSGNKSFKSKTTLPDNEHMNEEGLTIYSDAIISAIGLLFMHR